MDFRNGTVEDVMGGLEKYHGCGNCVIACPEEALVLEEVRPLSHIRVK